jgi:hypothetical protein
LIETKAFAWAGPPRHAGNLFIYIERERGGERESWEVCIRQQRYPIFFDPHPLSYSRTSEKPGPIVSCSLSHASLQLRAMTLPCSVGLYHTTYPIPYSISFLFNFSSFPFFSAPGTLVVHTSSPIFLPHPNPKIAERWKSLQERLTRPPKPYYPRVSISLSLSFKFHLP